MIPFDNPLYRVAFEEFRRLPEPLFMQYFQLLRLTRPAGTLLDLGAGPGLQTEQLLTALPLTWDVLAVEPSHELAAAARSRLAHFGARAKISEARLQDLHLASPVAAAWLSEVAHLLGEPISWVPLLATHLAPQATVVIRTSTHDQLRHRRWYDYFPRARKIDISRHPPKAKLIAALSSCGFTDVRVVTVDETRTVDAAALLTFFQDLAFSTLHMLSEDEIAIGLRRLTEDLEHTPSTRWDYLMTAYCATFRGA